MDRIQSTINARDLAPVMSSVGMHCVRRQSVHSAVIADIYNRLKVVNMFVISCTQYINILETHLGTCVEIFG